MTEPRTVVVTLYATRAEVAAAQRESAGFYTRAEFVLTTRETLARVCSRVHRRFRRHVDVREAFPWEWSRGALEVLPPLPRDPSAVYLGPPRGGDKVEA